MSETSSEVSSSEGYYPSVCIVTSPIGVADIAVHDLLSILDEITQTSIVTANLPEDSPIRDEYEWVNIATGRNIDNILMAATLFIINQIKMCREIQKRDEEVILFYGAIAYALPILFAKILGKTVVLEPRADSPLDLRIRWAKRVPAPIAWFLASIVRLLERIGYRVADHIITYTPSMAHELGLTKYEGKLHTEGARFVDTDSFRPTVPYEERDKIVGFIGRIEANKGMDELAEVARLLPEDTKFVFAGDGSMKEWLVNELKEERESGKVEFTGWIDHEDVPGQLNRMKLLVMPSEPTEGLPTVMLEALACGTPVCATPVSGVPDVVVEGETGFHMEETEPETIAEKIEETVAAGNKKLSDMSANCRSLAENEYSFDASVSRYSKILESF